MSKLTQWMDRTLYPDYRAGWDHLMFREKIIEVLTPDAVLLDMGAGAGIVKELDFRGHCATIHGVDPDERVKENPFIDEGRVGFGEQIPYPDNSHDVVISSNVWEHLEQPEAVLKEVARVLKPGGLYLSKTPNKTHYMPLIARLTPHSFHEYINEKRGRAAEDTFPTVYKINTRRDVKRIAEKAGFRVQTIHMVEGRSEYLRLWAPLYFGAWLYDQAVTKIPFLAGFRVFMIVVLEKKSEA